MPESKELLQEIQKPHVVVSVCIVTPAATIVVLQCTKIVAELGSAVSVPAAGTAI
jgi:hypothetical protein